MPRVHDRAVFAAIAVLLRSVRPATLTKTLSDLLIVFTESGHVRNVIITTTLRNCNLLQEMLTHTTSHCFMGTHRIPVLPTMIE